MLFRSGKDVHDRLAELGLLVGRGEEVGGDPLVARIEGKERLESSGLLERDNEERLNAVETGSLCKMTRSQLRSSIQVALRGIHHRRVGSPFP